MGSPTLRVLLLLTSFLLNLQPAALQTHHRCPCGEVLTNFDCSIYGEGDLPSLCSQCQHKRQESPSQLLPALLLSTVQCCKDERQTCLQVYVALNSTGIEGLELDFLVLNSNRYGKLRVVKTREHQNNTGAKWQMQFGSFQVASRDQILVSVKTIPSGKLKLSQNYTVTNNQSGGFWQAESGGEGEPSVRTASFHYPIKKNPDSIFIEKAPEFQYKWVPASRAIEVSAPKAITARLCHNLGRVCTELHQSFHQEVLVSKHRPAVLPYEFLLPCLCIEASHNHQDSLRKMVCPFQDQPKAYAADLWSSAHFQHFSSSAKTEMAICLSGRCSFHPTVSLCWKENSVPEATCQDIPNSTVPVANWNSMPFEFEDPDKLTVPIAAYIVESVDVNPQLCFKFSYMNTSHTECPHQTDTTWNVSLSVKFLQLHLNFHSRTPASFSSALCQPVSSSQCQPEPPVYTITHTGGSALGEMNLILPWTVSRSCVLVWRSDVQFAGKRLLCPDVSHRRWGLLAFAVGLGLGLLALAIYLIHWNTHRLRRDAPCCHHSRPILLIYSPDSEEHKQLVCSFAALLQSALGCPVLLDLWELGHVGRLGILPWVYAQRELVSRKQGQVLLLWSAGSANAYGLWQGEASSPDRKAPEPYDLFGAAMACLQGELQGTAGMVQRCDWVITYFSKLCDRRNIPRALRLLPRYRLPQDLPDLVGLLQGNSSSGPSWLHASAKALVCHLFKAEKKRSSRKQRNQPWNKNIRRLEESLFPLAQPKVQGPSCA
ncbi:interleukin-17 receptor E isoform X1 [Pantherophis guttatus]|uniref:Interleukin-17 receptor E isoform X1 n=1 Tax=Pantherophis guttatus TaxID=94885 RepID=A0A6P9CWL8_PANGU|nr:interleukin-17 receptor E isoform X1 [Pantherophis guttatus]